MRDSFFITMEENHTVEWQLVALLDVLGQQEKIRQWHIPRTPQERAVMHGLLRETLYFVLELRDLFGKVYESFEAGFLERRSEAKVRPQFLGFSDSFITSLSLRGQDAVVTCASALSAARAVMLSSLASGYALRGGIDVGLGVWMATGEPYGQALSEAHVLESYHAQWPRILIGDGLWKYLSDNSAEDASSAAVKACLRELLVFTDAVDGRRCLDYLGRGFSEPSPTAVATVVPRAYQFVVQQHKEHLANGNKKLSDRYTNVRAYFESRLPLWGLAAIRA